MPKPSAALFAPLLFFCAAAGLYPASEIVDGLGRRLDASKPAKRIVCLSPAAAEMLFAMGAEASIAALSSYCDYPAAAAAKPKIGGFSGKSVSIEAVVALKPDLVVVEAEMHQVVVSLFERAGLRCYACGSRGLADSFRIFRELGRLSGRAAEADRLAAGLESRIAAVRERVAGAPRPTALWVIWDDPLMAAGGATFISEALEAAGARNAFGDAKEAWPTLSFEAVLARDPDWLLSSTDHGVFMNVAALASRKPWSSLKAVRGGRVGTVDADSINRAGPRLVDAVEALARLLHPERFK